MEFKIGDLIAYEPPRQGPYGFGTVYEYLGPFGDRKDFSKGRLFGGTDIVVLRVDDKNNQLRLANAEELAEAVIGRIHGTPKRKDKNGREVMDFDF